VQRRLLAEEPSAVAAERDLRAEPRANVPAALTGRSHVATTVVIDEEARCVTFWTSESATGSARSARLHATTRDVRFRERSRLALEPASPSLRDRRFSANQTVFRRANERLRRRADSESDVDPVLFTCECGNEACEAPVPMTIQEYEIVRAESNQFVIVRGHEILGAGAERVVATYDGYDIVAKFGAAGAVAEATDPRAERHSPA
jgi:hypothetical protein